MFINVFKLKVNHVKLNLTEHAYCWLSCQFTAEFVLCQATVTMILPRGQGHQNEHEHILYHAEVYRHAKVQC